MRLKILLCGALIFSATSANVWAGPKPSCDDPNRGTAPCDSHTHLILPSTILPVATTNAHTIVIRYVNPLRYRYSLTGSSQVIAAPTPPTLIAPGTGVTGVLPPSSHSISVLGVDPNSTESQFNDLWTEASKESEAILAAIQDLNGTIVTLSQEQQCYADRLSYFGAPILSSQEEASLTQFVKNNDALRAADNPAPQSCRLKLSYDWPTATFNDLDTKLYQYQARQRALERLQDYAAWIAVATNKAENDQLTTYLAAAVTAVEAKEAPSAQFTTFVASLAYVNFWRTRVSDIFEQLKAHTDSDQQGSPFFFSSAVDCSDNWYGRGKTSTVTLTTADLSVTPASQLQSQILINTCYPSGTVSAGIGVSFVHDTVYAFLPGIDPNNSANTISAVQTTTDAKATPLYVIQYNIALAECARGFGLHAAIGGGVGSTSGTTNLELLLGPAISVRRRAFFITPAFQLARRDQLLPGYKIGSPEGNGLTSLPVKTNWKPGFALTFTFGFGT